MIQKIKDGLLPSKEQVYFHFLVKHTCIYCVMLEIHICYEKLKYLITTGKFEGKRALDWQRQDYVAGRKRMNIIDQRIKLYE